MTDILAKTFFLDQHGCAKNQVDGEILIARLEKLGFVIASSPENADLIVVNSCGFIETAKQESLNAVIDAKKFYPNAKVILAGCLAERYSDTLASELGEVDAVLGNGDLSLIDQAARQIFVPEGGAPEGGVARGKKLRVFKGAQTGVPSEKRGRLLSYKGSAYVKVTEGCDNHCTFCAIPGIRGSLRSRKTNDIVQEIRSLLKSGIFEVNLTAQDLAAFGCGKDDEEFALERWHEALYGGLSSPAHEDERFTQRGKTPLCTLLEKVSSIEGKFWLRLMYLHPDHITADVLEAVRQDERILPYFDVPFQSGDDSVIRAMGRKGSFVSYRSLVAKIRSALPQSCIRTTFLSGFPGETDAAAKTTEEFLRTIQCDWAGGFVYSREEGTAADKMKEQVSKKVAKKRAARLLAFQREITANRLKMRLSQTYDVLIEEVVEADDNEGLAIGRAWFDAPEVDGSFVVRYDAKDEKAASCVHEGAVVRAKAVSSGEFDVTGNLVL